METTPVSTNPTAKADVEKATDVKDSKAVQFTAKPTDKTLTLTDSTKAGEKAYLYVLDAGGLTATGTQPLTYDAKGTLTFANPNSDAVTYVLIPAFIISE